MRSAELYGQMAARWERKLGSNHPEVVTALKEWALMLRTAKRNSAANEVEQRVATIQAQQRQDTKPGVSLGFQP